MAQRPGGVVQITDAEGKLTEQHASTCAHCQKITQFESLKRMTDVTDFCRSCNKLICVQCADKVCRPWEAEMVRQEARQILFRDIARLGG